MDFSWLFYRGNDLSTQFLPDALFFKQAFQRGTFPIWNPWIFAGMPSLLDPQNFLWYPPNYLLLFFPLELGFIVLLLGHLAFAGYFIKRLLYKLPTGIQLLGMYLYVCSPKVIVHIEEGNWSLIIAATWLPALYYALRDKKFWLLVVSLSALVINNLNIGYYAVLFTGFFIIHQKRSDLEDSRSDLLKLFKVLLLTALITIPRWLPLALYGSQTVRAHLAEAPLPYWSWTKIAKSLLFPLDGTHPVLQNEEILYSGVIPILLLIWKGWTLREQGPTFRSWMFWILFLLFVALNNKTPIFSIIHYFPGFSLFRITTRPWIFIALFIALTVPRVIARIFEKSKILGVVGVIGIVGEFGIFGYGIFVRRIVPVDALPLRFYQEIVQNGAPVRAYCTTGCLDRLTAQTYGIALLGGNNPIQLTAFVRYLERAGGYRELAYHPILPPYTVFSSNPQPDAKALGETSTQFVVSPYELTGPLFDLIDQEDEYRLYKNKASIIEFRDHYFPLTIPKRD